MNWKPHAPSDVRTWLQSATGDPSRVDIYPSADGGDPLTCAACGGRIGGWGFTLGDGVAYHTEHDPDYVPPPRDPRKRWARAVVRLARRWGY